MGVVEQCRSSWGTEDPALIPWDEIGDLSLGLLRLCCCEELAEDLSPGNLPS